MADFVQFSQKSVFIPLCVNSICSCSSSISICESVDVCYGITQLLPCLHFCMFVFVLVLMFVLLHCFLFEMCCTNPTNWLQFYFYSGFGSFLDARKISKIEKLLHVIVFALLTSRMQVANGKWCTCPNGACLCVCARAREREFEVVERTMKYVNGSTNKTRSVNIKPSSHFSCTLCIHRKPYLLSAHP